MNRIRFATISLMMIFAVAALAQQAGHPRQAPSVDEHVKMLADQLNLTADQQAKVKPMVQQMTDDMNRIMQDQSLSREERGTKIKAVRTEADKKLRAILTEEQKRKLDELEANMHSQAHGQPQH